MGITEEKKENIVGMYRIAWTEETWKSVRIEAKSVGEALGMFARDNFDKNAIIVDDYGYIQDSIEIEEVA